MRAAAHPFQEARLAALERYQILDTEREAGFDEIAELAAKICEAPIAVVNLIDRDRQWFKAEVGLGVRSTPLDTSLCSHVILERDFVEIPDTLRDPRMADNPLCTGDPGLRFYAGALLLSEDGLPLGTLCILDYRPRRLTDLQREAIRVLANQVMTQLDLRLALRRQDVLRGEIDHRVKNSLQSVSAVVRLQAVRAESEAVRAALDEVAQRIATVAAIHEELDLGGAEGQVALDGFINRITRMLAATMPQNLAIQVDVAPITLDVARATSLGVLVNEFVANSVKHAFPGERPGNVRIVGSNTGEGYALQLSDDGVGDEESIAAIRQSTGLGCRIIAASAHSAGATAQWETGDPGVACRVELSR